MCTLAAANQLHVVVLRISSTLTFAAQGKMRMDKSDARSALFTARWPSLLQGPIKRWCYLVIDWRIPVLLGTDLSVSALPSQSIVTGFESRRMP